MADIEEIEKTPMGYTYKYITLPGEKEGQTVTKRVKYFPYTRTRAVFDDDGISLDVILFNLKNWTGYSLTTDITWEEPGVYALDASVGGKFYKLCNEVFQSANDARYRISNAIGTACNDNTSFSDIKDRYLQKANRIKTLLDSQGGKCPADPTMDQLYDAISRSFKYIANSIDKSVYHKFRFKFALSYDEIVSRFKSGDHYNIEIQGNELRSIIGALYGKKIAWARINFPTRFGYGSEYNSYMQYDQWRDIYYSHRFNNDYSVLDIGSHDSIALSGTDVYNGNNGNCSYNRSDHDRHWVFKNTNDTIGANNCEASHFIQFTGTYLYFRIWSFHTEYAKGEFYGMDYTKKEKNEWKAGKNIEFEVLGHYIDQ